MFGLRKEVEVWQLIDSSPQQILLYNFLGENSGGKVFDENFSNAEMVNLRELQVDDISAKFTAESTKKYIPVR